MTTFSNNDNENSGDNVKIEEPNAAQKYISEFFMYLHQETGFTKKAFTAAGLEMHLKKIAKNCFRLQICDNLLQSLIKVALVFSESINYNKIKKAIEIFVMSLFQITNFLVKYYLGSTLITLTTGMSSGMVFFLITLFYVVMFIYQNVSAVCFMKLKNWIIMLFNSDKVQCFFENVFPNYGRALAMA